MSPRPVSTVRPPTSAIESAAADWVTRCDAGLTAAEQQIFQDWLAGDARHAEAFDRLSEAWAVFDRVQEGGAISAVLAGLERRARPRRVGLRREAGSCPRGAPRPFATPSRCPIRAPSGRVTRRRAR